MKEIKAHIGENLKTIRKARALSLDSISELTGVSKAMLGQIERGESSPTVATLWKIASGLKVSFSAFLGDMSLSREIEHVPFEQAGSMVEERGFMRVHPVFLFDASRGFEVFNIELDPNCVHMSEAHNEGVEEHILVIEGRLQVNIEDHVYELGKGDAIRYRANKKHGYVNIYDKPALFQNLIFYFNR